MVVQFSMMISPEFLYVFPESATNCSGWGQESAEIMGET